MTKRQYNKRYDDRDPRVKEYMGFFIDALIEKYGFINPEFLVSLDLLADNLEVMFTARDEIKNKGRASELDKYRGDKKSPAVATFFNAQVFVNKLISSFGFTPSAASKIKENHEKTDAKKLLAAIKNIDTDEDIDNDGI